MNANLTLVMLLLAVSLVAATEKYKEPPLVLPTFVVVGFLIPTSWLEVSWECKGPLPFNLVKRAWLSKVGRETPAAKVGLKVGDILLSIDHYPVETIGGERLRELLQLERDPGTKLELTVQTPAKEKRTVTILFERK